MPRIDILDLDADRLSLLIECMGVANGAVETHLRCKGQALLRGRSSTKQCVISIEMFGDLLEGRVARFDIEEIDNCKLNTEPHTIADQTVSR